MTKKEVPEEIMTEKVKTPKKVTKEKTIPDKEVRKSRRKVSFKEFFIGRDIRRETLAAIRMKTDGEEFKFEEEWKEILEKYRG